MEARSQGKRVQGTLGFRSSKKLLQQPQKDDKKRLLPSRLKGSVQQTWLPTHDSRTVDKRVEEEKLPERLILLEELYNSMEAAISLLRIRRGMCTFSTIAAAVESSTQRRFLRSHLAQMKHILPEALQIEEHILWDAELQSSRRDLRITLLPISNSGDSSLQRIKSPQKSTDMVLRRREFHNRLVAFHHINKEIAVDVPEASMFKKATSCISVHSTEPKPSLKIFEDIQEEIEVCKTSKQVEASQPDCTEALDTEQAGELLPLSMAFDVSQLKKYPRSPSKLPHLHRISPVPTNATLSHLPPIFKPHFSVRKQTSSDCLVRSDASEKAPDMVPASGSIAAIRPHFSLKKCTEAVVSSIPCTPQEMSTQAVTPETVLSSPLPAATTQVSLLLSPPAGTIKTHEPKCRTPAHSDCAVLSSSFTSPAVTTLVSTPQQAVFTPSIVTTPSAGLQSKEAEAVPAKRRKQAVIKSLRFGTPTKHGLHEVPKFMNVKEATVAACSEAFLSPVKTPITDTFFIPKKPVGKVSRVLPFNSPGRTKNKESLQAACYEDTKHTPKRMKLSSLQVSELKPSSMKEVLAKAGSIYSPTGKLEIAASGDTADFVKLTSADRLSASDVEILKCLPQELLNYVQAKERKQIQDAQYGLEQARRRQQLIAGLPKLFNMVRLLFQSENRTVLTHKDLVKKVLSSHPDITDQGEIMEQLQLLVDFAPEWISSNRSSAGDLIYRINKNANMRAVSKGLVEAK